MTIDEVMAIAHEWKHHLLGENDIRAAILQLVEQEREECVQACRAKFFPNPTTTPEDAVYNTAISMCIDAIRARSKT